MPSSPESEQRAKPAKAPPRAEASTCAAWHPDSRRDLQKRHGLLSNPGSHGRERPHAGHPLEAKGATPHRPEDLGMCSCWLGRGSRTNSQGLSAGSHNLERQAFALPFTGLGPRPKKVSTPLRTGWPGRPAAAPQDPASSRSSAQLQEARLFWCDTIAGRGAGPRQHSAPDMESGTPTLQCWHSGPPGRTPPPVLPGWEQAVCSAWVSWG